MKLLAMTGLKTSSYRNLKKVYTIERLPLFYRQADQRNMLDTTFHIIYAFTRSLAIKGGH